MRMRRPGGLCGQQARQAAGLQVFERMAVAEERRLVRRHRFRHVARQGAVAMLRQEHLVQVVKIAQAFAAQEGGPSGVPANRAYQDR